MRDISELKSLKKDLMLKAAEQFQEEKVETAAAADSGFESLGAILPSIREDNFELREAARAEKGIKPPPDFTGFERLIGKTNDLKSIAPNDTAKKAGRPVARLHQYVENREPRGFGTGFMVSRNLLLTNHHVFTTLSEAKGCAANFFYEVDEKGVNPGTTFLLNPDRFFINFEDLDFALVAVEPVSIDKKSNLAEIGFIRLIETVGKVKVGEPINIIQYPAGGPKQYAYTDNTVSSFNDEKGLIRYTTDTLGASSGSPGFNKFYEVAALHHMGIPVVLNGKILTKNNTVWDGEDEDEVQWVANEGIGISRIVAYLKKLQLTETEKASLLAELLATTNDPLFESGDAKPVNPLTPADNTGVIIKSDDVMNKSDGAANNATGLINKETIKPIKNMEQLNFNFYGSTTIYINTTSKEISITPTQELPAAETTEGALEKSIRFDEDYDAREARGYKENFLTGFNLELPTVDPVRSGEMLKSQGEDLILKYYHYSLAMNKKRRMAMWTAVNVDYSFKLQKSRVELGKDEWRSDPRIAPILQITRKDLYDPARNIDLGHIVRRNDSCWGENNNEEEAEFANADTFHYTNCTPQHEAFNRSNPPKSEGYEGIHGIWGKLEDEIQKQLELSENRASIFAGPVLDNANDPTEDFGLGKIQYPMKFWKVIVVNDKKDGLLAYGFLLDQTDVVKKFGLDVKEKLDFKTFKKQQAALRLITKLTGVIFDNDLYKADVLKNNFHESEEPTRAYDNVGEIQIRPNKIVE